MGKSIVGSTGQAWKLRVYFAQLFVGFALRRYGWNDPDGHRALEAGENRRVVGDIRDAVGLA